MGDHDTTCEVCGKKIQPELGCHESPDDAYVALEGRWIWMQELDTAVFVVSPDSGMTALALPDGRVGLIIDDGASPTRHLHKTCQEDLIREGIDLPGADFFWDDEDMLRRRKTW